MIRAAIAAFVLVAAAPVQAHHAGRAVTATVYDGWYHGRTTACGTAYQHWGISAAHPWLDCGTQVRVTHRGRSITVPITDRCDCASLDLSAGAAHRLGVPLDGTATVRISHR
jgi:rare lipoprotein A